MNLCTLAVDNQGHQDSKLFVDLIGEEILNEFLGQLLEPETEHKIIDFSVKLLQNFEIPVSQNDIYVRVFSADNSSFKIQISENLEKELQFFEMLNPEYFI